MASTLSLEIQRQWSCLLERWSCLLERQISVCLPCKPQGNQKHRYHQCWCASTSNCRPLNAETSEHSSTCHTASYMYASLVATFFLWTSDRRHIRRFNDALHGSWSHCYRAWLNPGAWSLANPGFLEPLLQSMAIGSQDTSGAIATEHGHCYRAHNLEPRYKWRNMYFIQIIWASWTYLSSTLTIGNASSPRWSDDNHALGKLVTTANLEIQVIGRCAKQV